MINLTEDFKDMLTSYTTSITDQINIVKYSTQKDSPEHLDTTTVFPANRWDPPLDGGQSTKIGGMWTLKHDIS